MKPFTTEIIEAGDGTGDGILQFPDEFVKEQDWREGDQIHMEVINGELVIRNLDWMKRENIFNQASQSLDQPLQDP
jgi:hypothetical protein